MKSFFTQSTIILMEYEPSIDEIEQCLTGYTVLGRNSVAENWAISGSSIIVAFRPEVRGVVVIDVVPHQWPDDMGHPQTNPVIFVAWGMGQFGPFVFPDNLARATQQAWGWPEASRTVARHTAFLRIRLTYASGAQPNDALIPNDYSAQSELAFITQLVLKLYEVPNALCYFNPNAEFLCTFETLKYAWERYKSSGQLPLQVWSNRRLFNVADKPGWSLMDTVGMQQLDVMDHEAFFKSDAYDPNDVVHFLLGLSEYTVSMKQVINDGDTVDGPGNCRWQAKRHEKSLIAPPRPILRWLPQDGHETEVF